MEQIRRSITPFGLSFHSQDTQNRLFLVGPVVRAAGVTAKFNGVGLMLQIPQG